MRLPSSLDYEDRKDFLNDNLLYSQELLTDEYGREFTLEEYYNIRSLSIDTREKRELAIGRWLGTNADSSTGSRDDHIKETLDFIGHYLMSAKDVGIRWKAHEFKRLERDRKKGEFSCKEDEQNYFQLRSEVSFYHVGHGRDMRDDVVFFSNVGYIEQLKKAQHSDYIANKLRCIEQVEREIEEHSNQYHAIVAREDFIMNQIKNSVEQIEGRKKKSISDQRLDDYADRLEVLRNKKNNVLDQIRTLISEYTSLTELEVNYH